MVLLAQLCLVVVACLCLPTQTSSSSWSDDLKRARTHKPRSGFRGHGTLMSANMQLNKHLRARQGLRVRACEEFTVVHLRDLLRTLLPHTSEELKKVYPQNDGRQPAYAKLEDMDAHWDEIANQEDVRIRDAHCHEVVMWFTHHLTTERQKIVAKDITLPLLPAADHTMRAGTRASGDKAGHFYDQKVTCQKCHVGGIDNLGVPDFKPETELAKKRRCYTNYKELFNITCAPCDGIAGPYTGDADKYFTPTECLVVGTPEEIPESERIPPRLPPQFTVDVVGGSDRFGRTTAPVNDQLPSVIAKIYGQIHGKWYMDAQPGSDLWLLRHDTVYAKVTEDGVPIPFIAPQLSEIHAQTAKQRATNNSGPMVSLIHGLPNWVPGGCTCMPDPVGVPDVTASMATGLANMQYLGRIKLPEIEYLKVPMELDHWADWFFHIFMEVNSSSPYYKKAPRRLASAYAGTAVYDNWIFEDPKIKDPTVWYRGIPTTPEKVGPSAGKTCMDTHHAAICANITQTTFPPKGESAGHSSSRQSPVHHGLQFFPVASTLHNVVSHLPKHHNEIVV